MIFQLGTVTGPTNVIGYKETCGGGLVTVANLGVKLLFFAAGLFALWKFFEAGFAFINSGGDPQAVAQARDKIMFAFIGLLVMVSSFALAALIGTMMFGDAGALLTLSLTGAGDCTQPTP